MTILQRVNAIPTSGQFVAIYTHDLRPWAITFFRNAHGLLQYSEESDQFENLGTSVQWLESMKPVYYIAA